MARPGFYADNLNRRFPFLANQADELTETAVIVDCGFMMGLGSGYIPGTHEVWLDSVSRVGSIITFTFVSDAPGVATQPLVFTRDISDSRFSHEYSSRGVYDSVSESVSMCEVGDADIWSGYLVTGDLDSVAEATVTGAFVVEQALVRSLNYVRSIGVANADRTRYQAPDGCKEVCWPVPLQDIYVRARCLTGPIFFQAGYNLNIWQASTGKSLRFDAIVGAGLGEPCEQVPVFVGEMAPDDRVLLDGSPACDEVFHTINGIGGQRIDFIAGNGVGIAFDPEKSLITVAVNLLGMSTGIEDPNDSISVSDVEYGSESCDCGPV